MHDRENRHNSELMPRRPPLSSLTSAQLYERAAQYAGQAKTTRSAKLRETRERIATRYVVLAIERESLERAAMERTAMEREAMEPGADGRTMNRRGVVATKPSRKRLPTT
jgi:hypothetical protein